MSLELNLDIWEALQEHCLDTRAAADDFVEVLIENGIDAEKIAVATQDSDIRSALIDYDIEIEEEDTEDTQEYVPVPH